MLDKLTEWLIELVKAFFSTLWSFLVDLAIALVDGVLAVIATLVEALPVPDFVSGGLQGLLGSLGAATLYILVGAGLPSALAVLGAGYAFRMVRKIVTLFQW